MPFFWLLFVLAHEIGRIAKGHLPTVEGEAIVDDMVEISAINELDLQEREANSFATCLLAPDGMEVSLPKPLPTALRLAALASAYGREHCISPGSVILNAVHNSTINGKKPFALGQVALKLIGNSEGAEAHCRQTLRDNVDMCMLRDDTIDFLEKLGLI